MNCIAIDDEPLALKLLERYCNQATNIQLLGTFADPLEGILNIRKMQPDLIFLDIRMPDISGIDIVQSIKQKTFVIFTTAHKEYAVEGFELDVVDYLLKPFSFDRFLKACTKAEQRMLSTSPNYKTVARQQTEDVTISFKYNYQNIRLSIQSILYIEAFDNYIKIATTDKIYMPIMTMKNIQKLLPAEFIRIHKSFIVSTDKIKSFNYEHVIISEKKKIPIGRSYRKEFQSKMNVLKEK
ncbi:MAG: LytTR family DNA-binding domain-containing protein [Tannerellaceae bacterium]|jgi:DNA-binding LytR/AlgR family response regulator|nr:LytTR family DNA-binding domain-containing protein [Tannerellaceae bacterium]